MEAEELIRQLEKKLDARYQEARRQIRNMRRVFSALDSDQKDAIDLSILDEPMGGEATLKLACEEIVNNCGSRGYYRLPDIVQQLQLRVVGLPKNPNRNVRFVLNELVEKASIKSNIRRGRAGTTYFPKERKKKNKKAW